MNIERSLKTDELKLYKLFLTFSSCFFFFTAKHFFPDSQEEFCYNISKVPHKWKDPLREGQKNPSFIIQIDRN